MIAFTICANNYLPEALSLGNSLEANGHAAADYLIFLVDQLSPTVPYQDLRYSVIQVNEEMVPDYSRLTAYYNVIELCTSVKASLFKFLIVNNPDEDIFSYFDPDLFFFSNPDQAIRKALGDHSVLLTPHVMQPVPIGNVPFENIFLNYGLYNLGFLALCADANAAAMLDWWEERTLKMGIANVAEGFFVDQLWMNLSPLFFKGVAVCKHPGFNCAYWNLNERSIEMNQEQYKVNGNFDLVFFHFSSFDFSGKRLSGREHTATREHDPVIGHLSSCYRTHLISNGFSKYKAIQPGYRVTFDNYISKVLPASVNKRSLNVALRLSKVPGLLRRLANLVHLMEIIKKYKAENRDR